MRYLIILLFLFSGPLLASDGYFLTEFPILDDPHYSVGEYDDAHQQNDIEQIRHEQHNMEMENLRMQEQVQDDIYNQYLRSGGAYD